MLTINAGNLKKGDFILYQDQVCQVQKAEFYSPGKGSALMRSKIKNLVNGKGVDYTFKSQDSVEVVEVASIEMQYLYKDADGLYFMDQNTYNQYTIPLDIVGDLVDYLKEGERCYVYLYNEKALSIRPPASATLKIIETEDAAKGDTVSGAKKHATLETGKVVLVPIFIKQGEIITVNPETGEYTGRVNS